jgi:transcriptional regulator with XRE-family HTH domain
MTPTIRPPLTGDQLRAARALAGINRNELSKLSKVAVGVIAAIETSANELRGSHASHTKLHDALHDLGIEILFRGSPSNGGGDGVRWKARPSG